MKNNAVIFDLDGTLWDSSESTFYSVGEIVKKHKLEKISNNTIKNVFGLNKEQAAKHYFPNIDLDTSLKYLREIGNVNINNLMENGAYIYPNLIDVLKNIKKKYKIFIVSNTSRNEYIEAFFNSSGSKEYFDGYLAASKIGISKQDAIKKIINDYKIDNAVYVGDTKLDYDSSINNNIPFIYAKYGFGKIDNYKYSINNLSELPEVLNIITEK